MQHSVPQLAPAPDEVLDDLDVVVFRTDVAGHWTYLNAAWTSILGFSVADTLGTSFLDYVHPDEREHTLALFTAVVEGGADYCHHRGRYRTADGGDRWLELRSRLLRDREGRIYGNAGVLIDVSVLAAAEETVLERAAVLELASGAPSHAELPVGVVLYGSDLTVRRASRALEQRLGPAVAAGAPLTSLECLLASGSPRGAGLSGPSGLLAVAVRTGRPQYAEVALVHAPGGLRRDLHLTVLPHPPGGRAGEEPLLLALVVQDVSELRRAERQQAAVAELAARALSGGDLGDLLAEVVAALTRTLHVSNALVLELLGKGEGLVARAAAGWPGGTLEIPRLAYDALPGFVERSLSTAEPVLLPRVGTDPVAAASPWLRQLGGSCASVQIGDSASDPYGLLAVLTTSPRRFAADEIDFLRSVAGVLGVAVERLRAEEQVRYQALHDPLTGLANRVLLHDRLEQALGTRRRTRQTVALLLLDLDRFKEINDTLGHDVGDEVLMQVAARLLETVRSTDTVARLGGDEFAVLLPGLQATSDALRVARKVREALREVVYKGVVPVSVEASVGVAFAPLHGSDPFTLLKCADVAMYRAKNLSVGVAAYAPEDDEHRPERLAYLTALRSAVDDDQLVLHFQPRLDLATGRRTAVEALVRWQHPTEGLLPPALFIPLAEPTGLMDALTRRVLELALEQARRWREQGRSLPVAVNVSASVLHDTDLVGTVLEALGRAGLPPSLLELEVTESAMMSSPPSAIRVAKALRAAGVRLSVDDFGTGHSSLAYLRDLPVSQLKIDRSFLRDVPGNERDVSIVRSVIELGHNLGLRVVGEGIETAESLALLTELGCDEGQGFLLGRPVPAALMS